jgi:hypothetical protein
MGGDGLQLPDVFHLRAHEVFLKRWGGDEALEREVTNETTQSHFGSIGRRGDGHCPCAAERQSLFAAPIEAGIVPSLSRPAISPGSL